jgi:hypothetical protein
MNRAPETIEQVREEMREIRSNLDDEVATFVQNTKVLFDWRSYLKNSPWLGIGAAALIGYLVVPSKPKVVSPSPEQLAEMAKHARVVVGDPPSANNEKTLAREMAGMALGIALRGGLSIALKQLNQFLSRPPGPTETPREGGPQR